MDFGIASVVGITVICYLIGQIIKATGLPNKWIPCIVGTAGAALGAVGMYIMPDFPAGDVLTAVAVGIVSGLAATGVDQLGKQLGQLEAAGFAGAAFMDKDEVKVFAAQ